MPAYNWKKNKKTVLNMNTEYEYCQTFKIESFAKGKREEGVWS